MSDIERVGWDMMELSLTRNRILRVTANVSSSGRPVFCFVVAVLLPYLVSCASMPDEQEETGASCGGPANWLQDVQFEQINQEGEPWIYSQHAGDISFQLSEVDGTLEITRIKGEPWMILRQTVDDTAFEGAKIRFSAEVRGNAPAEPLIHGFEHKAGLYLHIGNRRDPILADHSPNNGEWDWQRVTVEREVPEGEQAVHAGFVHQSGGTLWVRNPQLTIVDCQP